MYHHRVFCVLCCDFRLAFIPLPTDPYRKETGQTTAHTTTINHAIPERNRSVANHLLQMI